MRGGMEAWTHGGMDAWRHGRMDAWRHGGMETWTHGDVDAWRFRTHSGLRYSFFSSSMSPLHAFILPTRRRGSSRDRIPLLFRARGTRPCRSRHARRRKVDEPLCLHIRVLRLHPPSEDPCGRTVVTFGPRVVVDTDRLVRSAVFSSPELRMLRMSGPCWFPFPLMLAVRRHMYEGARGRGQSERNAQLTTRNTNQTVQ